MGIYMPDIWTRDPNNRAALQHRPMLDLALQQDAHVHVLSTIIIFYTVNEYLCLRI